MRPLGSTDPRQAGPYLLLGRLGAGGMGSVYLGRSAGGRTVAVKVVRHDFAADEDFRARFRREVQAARAVTGPFTAQLVDADPDAELPWQATAFVPGVPLSSAVRMHGPFPEHALRVLGTGLAEALQDIHTARIVHRDLKPANVMLAADGPHVIDFGISRSAENSALTYTGHIVGSPGFLSPEQATGATVVPATDVFALGATLAFAGLGIGPFGDGPTPALLYRVVSQEPELSGLPEPLQEIVHACLAKEPAARPTPEQVVSLLATSAADLAGPWLPAPVLAAIAEAAGVLTDGQQLGPTPTEIVVPAAQSVRASVASGADPRLGFGAAPASPAPAPVQVPVQQTPPPQLPSCRTATPAAAPAPASPERGGGVHRRTLLGVLGGAVLAGGGVAAYLLNDRQNHSGGGASADGGRSAGPGSSSSATASPTPSPSSTAIVPLAKAPQRFPVWHQTLPGAVGSLGVGSGTVVIGLEAGSYRALAPADGSRLWKNDVEISEPGATAVPYFDGRTVYLTGRTPSGTAELQAIDTDNGSLRWKAVARDSEQVLEGVQGRQGDTLYVSGFDNKGVRGNLLWAVDANRHTTDYLSWSTDLGSILVPEEGEVDIITVGGRDVAGISGFLAGDKVWQRKLSGLNFMTEDTSMCASWGGRVYVVANGLHVLDRTTGKDLVKTVPLGMTGPGRVLANGSGRLFAAAGRALFGINPADGSVQWTAMSEKDFVQITAGDTGTSWVTMAATENVLYALDTGRTLYALDAATGSCLWRYSAPQTAASLAAYGEYVFLTADRNLYAFR